jgi:hypothetical protein
MHNGVCRQGAEYGSSHTALFGRRGCLISDISAISNSVSQGTQLSSASDLIRARNLERRSEIETQTRSGRRAHPQGGLEGSTVTREMRDRCAI